MSSSPPPNSAPSPISPSPPSPPAPPATPPGSDATAPPPQPASSPPPPGSGTTPKSSSPPPTSTKPPPPSPPGKPSPSNPPPPASPGSLPPSSNSVSTALVVGLSVGAVVIILSLGIACFCLFTKKRRPRPLPPPHPPHQHYGTPPPPPQVKDQPYRQHQNWHNASQPGYNVVKIPSNPPVPPFAPRPPHPPGHFGPPPPTAMSNSGGSGSSQSGPENPPSHGITLGFLKSIFTYEELAIATDDFSDANLLGQGGFGYVHRGKLPNGKEVAVKQLKAGSGQGEREFQAEVDIISRVHHRHLVSLVGYCIADGKRLLIYEFVPNNTLEFHLHGEGLPALDWDTRLKIALGSAKGLAYLHEDCHPKIIHRDIKASNILLDFDFEAKVADFGLAKIASETNTHVSTRVMGTFGYLAPEYASSGKLTDKSDVFSFGVMLLELITGRRPYDSNQSAIDDSLVDWARPLLTRALDDGNFDALVDPCLVDRYNHTEMKNMIACAASSVRHSAKRRPPMSQIVRTLEGDVSLEDLNEGLKPGNRSVYGSSDYDTMQYNEDMKRFRKLALASQEYGSSGYSAPTSEYGQIPSASSSEGRQTQEMEMGRVKKDC